MNAIKHTKLTMALGAALVAGAMTANLQARELDINEFTHEARARVMTEVTAQPGTGERLRQLRGALNGARVVAGLPSAGEQREQALAHIHSEQLEGLRAAAPEQLAGAITGARIVADLPSADEYAERAIAAIKAEQLGNMRSQTAEQLSASLAGAQVMHSIADARPAGQPKQGEWAMPEVEFKPLLDMSILHFSFRK